MLRRRLTAANLSERYARILEIEVGIVLSHLAGGLRLTLGELGVIELVARAKRLGALQRHPCHVRARPFAFEIRIAPRCSRRPVGIVRSLSLGHEGEGEGTEDAERRDADPLHGLLYGAGHGTGVYLSERAAGAARHRTASARARARAGARSA